MLAKKIKKQRKSSASKAGFLFFLASTVLLLLCSCSEKAQDAPAKPSVQRKESKSIDEKKITDLKDQNIQNIKEYFTYNPNGKVDPFVPILFETADDELIKQKAGSKNTELDIPMTPLQKLDVDDFTLVAVIATPTGYCALLEDPAMNGYKVKEGMQIGRKSGVVKKIVYNSVIIEENSEIDKKDSEKKINTLTLRKK